MNTVTLHKLRKTFSDIVAVDDVTLEVGQGELFGLIGPDGAGKTSIFRMLTTLLLPDSGTASVSGLDIVKDFQQIRSRVGYMPGRFSLYQDLTVEENLEFFATVHGTTVKENYGLISEIYEQISAFKDRRAGKLSGGMKQKLALCCALIHKPDVLFLDEPTTGVDVVSRREFWKMLHTLKEQRITILVSTPYMDEADLCDRIALMHSGRILKVNTPQAIVRQYPKTLYAVTARNIFLLLICLRSHPAIEHCYAFGEFLHVTLQSTQHGTDMLRKIAQENGIEDFHVHDIVPSIEDSFIRLMAEKDFSDNKNNLI